MTRLETQPATVPSGAPDAMASGGAERYLYAVIPSGTRPAGQPLEDQRSGRVEGAGPAADGGGFGAGVELVTAGRLCAVVGPVPPSAVEVAALFDEEGGAPNAEPALEALEAAVRDHERVVERVLARVRTVLPVRFGTVLGSTDAVRDVLQRREHELAACLEGLEGRREWGLKVQWEAAAAAEAARTLVTAPDSGSPEVAGPGTLFFVAKRLERAMADALREAAAGVAWEIDEAVRPLGVLQARRAVPEKGTGEDICVFDGSLLVALEEEQRLSEALESVLTRHRGLSASLSGPWPPYSFAGPVPLDA